VALARESAHGYHHYRQEFTPDRFHPEQVVCSFPPCQRLRRNEYHRRKIAADPEYRDVCADSQSYWKEKNPDYLKQYRAKSKSGKTVANKHESALEEVLRQEFPQNFSALPAKGQLHL
jgi:hypothetical protein